MNPQIITIILVEDNPDDVELTLRVFKKHNIANEIIVLKDGAEALEYISRCERESDSHPLPQLILLDLKLPKVNGLEVLKKIKSTPKTQSIPVVVLTTSKEEFDLTESYRLGVNSYICKPVSFDDFVAVVKQLSLYWVLLNEAPPV